MSPKPLVRHHSKYVPLTREAFRARFFERFSDPVFDDVQGELEKICERAWDGYIQYRKAPRTQAAGPGFADPAYQVSLDWLKARKAIREAQQRHDAPASPSRILVVNGSTRSEHSCPGEISKTLRLALHAQAALGKRAGFEVDLLNMSALADEPWKVIHPCKACVSTAMPLCHWPCSCYPNHAMGQTNDWMAELYPRWVAAHGVMVLCPVNWYQAPSSLKLMIDRLVCADGGNPDPSSTHGKNVEEAKALELKGWPYPRHLAGRAFAVGHARGCRRAGRAAAGPRRLAVRHRHGPGGRRGGDGYLDRLLQAVRHQPRRARCRPGSVQGGRERRREPREPGGADARRDIPRAGCGPAGSAAEVS